MEIGTAWVLCAIARSAAAMTILGGRGGYTWEKPGVDLLAELPAGNAGAATKVREVICDGSVKLVLRSKSWVMSS